MMRPGLQTPGAIPFLTLIIFSLLSLVPSLLGSWDKDWSVPDGKNAYIGCPRAEVGRMYRPCTCFFLPLLTWKKV